MWEILTQQKPYAGRDELISNASHFLFQDDSSVLLQPAVMQHFTRSLKQSEGEGIFILRFLELHFSQTIHIVSIVAKLT